MKSASGATVNVCLIEVRDLIIEWYCQYHSMITSLISIKHIIL